MLFRLPLLLFCWLLCCSTLTAAQELTGIVSWIYDGDTLQIENIGKVRLLGIDTPESKDSGRDRYYLSREKIPRKKLRQIARQAKQFNIEQVKGQAVQLRFDREKQDKYDRLLVYLYLPDGRMLNRLLLKQGLASVFRRYQFEQKKDFLAVEAGARQKQLGLWAE